MSDVGRFLKDTKAAFTYLIQRNERLKYILDLLKHYLGGIYYRMDTDHIFLFASGLAFTLILCIIPFILILFWILGNFLDSATVVIQVNNLIDTLIPYKQYADYAKAVIFKRIFEVVEFKNLAGIIGIGGLFFAASSFFSGLRSVLNKIFGAEKEINFLLGLLRDSLIITLSVLLFPVMTFLFPIIDYFRSIPDQYDFLSIFNLGIFQQAFTIGISIFTLFIMFWLIYKFVPTKKIRSRSAAVGAIWAALLWEAAKQLFGYYIRHFPTLGIIYGAYMLVVVVAFWLYYSAVVFIIGAEIGKLFDQRLQASLDLKEKKKLEARKGGN